jgi:ribosomal protein S13
MSSSDVIAFERGLRKGAADALRGQRTSTASREREIPRPSPERLSELARQKEELRRQMMSDV